MRDRVKKLLKELEKKGEKDLVLEFLIESQLLEFTLSCLIVQYSLGGLDVRAVSKMPLGALIGIIKKTGKSDLIELADIATEFNEVRKAIIHNLLFLDMPIEELITEVKRQISTGQDLQIELEDKIDSIYGIDIYDLLFN